MHCWVGAQLLLVNSVLLWQSNAKKNTNAPAHDVLYYSLADSLDFVLRASRYFLGTGATIYYRSVFAKPIIIWFKSDFDWQFINTLLRMEKGPTVDAVDNRFGFTMKGG